MEAGVDDLEKHKEPFCGWGNKHYSPPLYGHPVMGFTISKCSFTSRNFCHFSWMGQVPKDCRGANVFIVFSKLHPLLPHFGYERWVKVFENTTADRERPRGSCKRCIRSMGDSKHIRSQSNLVQNWFHGSFSKRCKDLLGSTSIFIIEDSWQDYDGWLLIIIVNSLQRKNNIRANLEMRCRPREVHCEPFIRRLNLLPLLMDI